jgi:hypothetical protein
MSIKDQVGQEQWRALFNAPSAASAFVSLSTGKGLEVFIEFFNASKFIQNEARHFRSSGYGKMADDFITEIKSMSPKEALADAITYKSKDLISIRTEAKKIVVDGSAVASSLPDGDGYKRWVFDLALNIAETKTGGFLGIGGKSVIDRNKQAALIELEEILGV